jgi:putative ABC transport system ATP-binding protein
MTATIDHNAAVACSRVTKHFGEGENRVEVLRGVDLQIAFGEMTLLVGPSGCGKTTMLSVIAGLLNRSGGELNVLGRDLAQLSGSDAVTFRRKNLGFVFQQFNLLPSLTAAENAAVPLLAAGVKKKEAVDRASALLDHLGLGNRSRAFPNQLSGGQQQRVALARALVHNPRLVVCDEPTSALDHETGQVVMDLLSRIAVKPGRAVVVVTHDSRVFNFADRIAHMDDGRIQEVRESAAVSQRRPPSLQSVS